MSVCKRCGGSISHLNKTGFCNRTPECNTARRQANSERYYANNKDSILRRQKEAYDRDSSRTLATCAEYRKNNPQKIRDSKRRSQYGLKPGEYDALVAAQEGRCRGCNRDDVKLHLDHDHACCPKLPTCGKCNRGLLCDRCNRAIGFVQDDPVTLRRLASYLEE